MFHSIGSNIYFYASGLNFLCFRSKIRSKFSLIVMISCNMSQRQAIIQLHCAGKINPQIVKLLKAGKSTVTDTIMRYKELGTCSDRPRCGRPRTARTQSKIKFIREQIRRDSKRSMRKWLGAWKLMKGCENHR